MNEAEYFACIVKDCIDGREKIMRILMARGFLIDYKNGYYFLSDNAAVEDYKYLKKLLEKYNLGTVVGIEFRDYVKKYGVVQKVIIPYTAKIIIYDEACLSDVMKAFNENKRIRYAICSQTRRWSEFCFRSYGEKIPVKYLEPYIAYFVKALSACGVYTNYSCDGNHPHGDRLIVESDYPFNLWQDYLLDNLIPQEYGMHFSQTVLFENDKYETYYRVYLTADYLYSNRVKLRSVKEKAIQNITKKYRHTHTVQEIESCFITGCEMATRTREEGMK